MFKFSIVDTGNHKKDIPYLVKELKAKGLISAMEKDIAFEPVYLTNNIVGVNKIMSEYDGLMLDVHKE